MTSSPRRWPRIPAAHSSSPKRSTASGAHSRPAQDERDRVAGVDDVGVGGRGVVAGHGDDRLVGRKRARARRRAPRSSPASRPDPSCGRPRRSPSGGRRRRRRRRRAAPSIRSTRRRRSAAGSSVSGSSIASSPIQRARPRRNADSPTNVPRSPCRCSKVGTGLGRPHHLSVITLKRSPRRPVDHRRASTASAARAVALGLGHERLGPQTRDAGRGRRRPCR